MSLTSNATSSSQICPLCKVQIDPRGTVHFSFGKPGTRERLYARVCKHVTDARCINSDESTLGVVTANDGYGFEGVSAEQLDTMLANASWPEQ
jgi:hypothetical protein